MISWLSWRGRGAQRPLLAIQGKSNHVSWYRTIAFGVSLAAHLIAVFIFQYSGKEQKLKLSETKPHLKISIVKVESFNLKKLEGGYEKNKRQLAGKEKIQQQLLKSTGTILSLPVQKIPASYYFHSKELSEKPLVVRDIPPDLGELFPEVTPQAVPIWLFINENGQIDHVRLDNSRLPPYAELLLSKTLARVRFYPGKINGLAVKSRLKIEVLIEPHPNVSSNTNRSLIQ